MPLDEISKRFYFLGYVHGLYLNCTGDLLFLDVEMVHYLASDSLYLEF